MGGLKLGWAETPTTYFCLTPLSCLFQSHWATDLLPVVTRLREEGVAGDNIVIILAVVGRQVASCQAWLVGQITGQAHLTGVMVKTVEEFRGMEAQVLVWVGGDTFDSTILDTCTRVTSRLVFISQAVSRGGGMIGRAVTVACQEGKAKMW